MISYQRFENFYNSNLFDIHEVPINANIFVVLFQVDHYGSHPQPPPRGPLQLHSDPHLLPGCQSFQLLTHGNHHLHQHLLPGNHHRHLLQPPGNHLLHLLQPPGNHLPSQHLPPGGHLLNQLLLHGNHHLSQHPRLHPCIQSNLQVSTLCG